MTCHSTPIADQLHTLGASLTVRVHEDRALSASELERFAARLVLLAQQTAPLERFHAELVAEAAAEELRQFSTPADFGASATRLPLSI